MPTAVAVSNKTLRIEGRAKVNLAVGTSVFSFAPGEPCMRGVFHRRPAHTFFPLSCRGGLTGLANINNSNPVHEKCRQESGDHTTDSRFVKARCLTQGGHELKSHGLWLSATDEFAKQGVKFIAVLLSEVFVNRAGRGVSPFASAEPVGSEP